MDIYRIRKGEEKTLIIIKYRLNTTSKEQTKVISKKIINVLEPSFIKSGLIVANDKKYENNSMYYITILDLQTKNEFIDVSMTKEIIKMLSNKFMWRFSSVHASKFNDKFDNVDINVNFIHVEQDNQKNTLNVSVYITGISETDVIDKAEKIFKQSLLSFNLLGASAYFKINNCFIVTVEIPLVENSIEEIRDILISINNEWGFTGFEIFSEECVLDESIVDLSIWFKEVKL